MSRVLGSMRSFWFLEDIVGSIGVFKGRFVY